MNILREPLVYIHKEINESIFRVELFMIAKNLETTQMSISDRINRIVDTLLILRQWSTIEN